MYSIAHNSIKNKGKNRCGDYYLWKEIANENILVAVVSDGVSTTPCDWLASETACKVFIKNIEEDHWHEKDIKQRIIQSLMSANREIIEIEGQCKGMLCTITAIVWEKDNDFAYCTWAGDSRIYWFDGIETRQFSKDQTKAVVMRKQDGKVLSTDGSVIIREGLTNALGRQDYKPIIEKLNFLPNQAILLCSDGFYQAFPDLETKMTGIFKNLNFETNFEAVFAHVADERTDDTTALVIRREPENVNFSEIIKNLDHVDEFSELGFSKIQIGNAIIDELLNAFEKQDVEYSIKLLSFMNTYHLEYSRNQLTSLIDAMKKYNFLNGRIYQDILGMLRKTRF